MLLKRKFFAMRPDTYKDLNEAEEKWLRSKRSKLASKFKGKKQKAIKDGNLNRKKMLEDLRREAEYAGKDIRGTGKNKYLKKIVNDASKETKALVDRNIKVLKKVGVGGLIVGGTALGAAGATKLVKDRKRNKTIKSVKEQVLKD